MQKMYKIFGLLFVIILSVQSFSFAMEGRKNNNMNSEFNQINDERNDKIKNTMKISQLCDKILQIDLRGTQETEELGGWEFLAIEKPAKIFNLENYMSNLEKHYMSNPENFHEAG